MANRSNNDEEWIKRVNDLVKAAYGGDKEAEGKLFEVVYAYLHEMAKIQLAADQIRRALRATSLVREAFMKIKPGPKVKFEDHKKFFDAAAHAMWEVRIERYRREEAQERKIEKIKNELKGRPKKGQDSKLSRRLERLRTALEDLAKVNARAAEVVRLRYLQGLKVKQVSELLGVSDRLVEEDFRLARAWLYGKIGGDDSSMIAS